MVAKRSRAAHRNGKRRKHQQRLAGMIAGVLVALAVVFLSIPLVQGTLFQKEAASTSSSSTTAVTQASSTEATTSEAPASSSESQVTWVKQEAPVKVPILMYHAVHVMAPEEEANANLIVDPTTFESQLQALQEAGYYTLSPEEAYKVLTENVLPKDKKVVWLTFDDSLWDFYDMAYPILKKYGMQATNNVITGTVGNAGNLTLDQIKEMKENGMSFQSHTVNHPDLEYSTDQAQEDELHLSKDYLDNQLAQDTIAVAYPAGRYSDTTIATAERNKYKLGVTTNEGLASADNGLLTLNRVRILPNTTAEILLQTIATQ